MIQAGRWPIETIGITGIYAFAVITAVVLWLQIREIFSRRSVESLSTTWIIYFCAMFASGLIYSVTYHRQPILINNIMLTSLHLGIAYGIYRFRGFSKFDWWFIAGLSLALVAMYFSPHQDIWFFAFAPGGVAALLKETYLLQRGHTPGVLNPWMIVVGVVSNGFWTAYALTVHDWALSYICPANLVIWSIMLTIWLGYRRKSVIAAEPIAAAGMVAEP